MNTIQQAFAKAGVPVKPLRERVWQLLKDFGPMTNAAIASRMGESELRIGQATSTMKSAGFLESSGKRGFRGTVVYSALGDSYEDAKTGRVHVKVTNIRPAPTPAPVQKAGLDNLPRELDKYTIGQLRNLRDTLNALFA